MPFLSRVSQLLCAFLCYSVGISAAAVKDLTLNDFDSFLTSNELSLVAFTAPWCIHCETLTPEYEAAAERLASEGLPLANVNCEEEEDICREYQIGIYPTIYVFHGKNHSVYEGFRTADAIEAFTKRHSLPIITDLESVQDVDEFKKKDNITVIGFFDQDDQKSQTIFTEVANEYRALHLFGTISHDNFGLLENVQKPAIVVFKSFDTGKDVYSEAFDFGKVDDFLYEAATPLISEIGVDIRLDSHLFSTGAPVALIFAETRDERTLVAEKLYAVAEATKGKLVWITADPTEYKQLVSRVALKPDRWPAFAIEDAEKDRKYVFPIQGSFSHLSRIAIEEFVSGVLAGTVTPDIRSDPLPTMQNGSVTTIVGDNYNDTVRANDKDVVVFYFSPTCEHCEAMSPSYADFADHLTQHTNTVTVAQIDATSNDVWPSVSSYPTVKLFKRGGKDSPVTYEGDRTANDLLKFVKDNGSPELAVALAGTLPKGRDASVRDEL